MQMRCKPTFFVFCAMLLVVCSAGLSGCAVTGTPTSGDAYVLVLDEGKDADVELSYGEYLVLDMRNPGDGGYKVTGVHFNPQVLQLEGYTNETPENGRLGDFGRLQYKFKVIGVGMTDVKIRIKRPWEKDALPEVYKRVNVVVK